MRAISIRAFLNALGVGCGTCVFCTFSYSRAISRVPTFVFRMLKITSSLCYRVVDIVWGWVVGCFVGLVCLGWVGLVVV